MGTKRRPTEGIIMKRAKIWFITDISHGIGNALAQAALNRGETVIGTSHDLTSDLDQGEGTLHVLPLDLTNREQVKRQSQTRSSCAIVLM